MRTFTHSRGKKNSDSSGNFFLYKMNGGEGVTPIYAACSKFMQSN